MGNWCGRARFWDELMQGPRNAGSLFAGSAEHLRSTRRRKRNRDCSERLYLAENDHLNVTPLHRHRRGVAIAATGRLSATLAFASGGSVSVSTEGNAGAACGESFS
jgi:hypothetical protein